MSHLGPATITLAPVTIITVIKPRDDRGPGMCAAGAQRTLSGGVRVRDRHGCRVDVVILDWGPFTFRGFEACVASIWFETASWQPDSSHCEWTIGAMS